ncbi:MAG: cytochrome c3 family protein [Gemmatimonadetes bacterium]|nr:cytochrome c3 family protein [Gemmatimonadota bacterium]
MRRVLNPALLALVAFMLVSTAACVDERIVYRDRDLTGDIPTGHEGFVGLTSQESNLTVCGNCHVSFQGEWEQTAHADAWATLQNSGHAQAFCENCHTVNQLGNLTEAAGGYATTGDARYHNVQCESCHGPGLAHVQSPGDDNIPLAPLAVGLDMTTGCGECHQGAHHPFVDEWAESGHGTALDYPAGRPECASCHSGEDALVAWGVRADFTEKEAVNQPGQHLAITCAVCHDPHSADNGGQLRFPVDVPNEEQNLCMKCHHKRGTPDMASQNRGPHSPEGPVLLGYGGWWPPNLQFGQTGDTATIAATHGSVANPRLCAGCHVNAYTATDDVTGAQIISTGHLFAATPCTVNGVPVPGDCAPAERTYRTCTDAGCHGSENVARSIEQVAELRIGSLATQLNTMLAQVPATEFNHNDGRYSTAEGARFNYQLAALFPGSTIHNPFLVEALLIASIQQVTNDYGIAPGPGVSLNRQLGQN